MLNLRMPSFQVANAGDVGGQGVFLMLWLVRCLASNDASRATYIFTSSFDLEFMRTKREQRNIAFVKNAKISDHELHLTHWSSGTRHLHQGCPLPLLRTLSFYKLNEFKRRRQATLLLSLFLK
jgi:hypothetical protein